jgi:hypothetical protein
MKTKNAIWRVAAFLTTAGSGAVVAHDGHGQVSTHWHATDAWGFVALGAMLAVAVWLSRRGK